MIFDCFFKDINSYIYQDLPLITREKSDLKNWTQSNQKAQIVLGSVFIIGKLKEWRFKYLHRKLKTIVKLLEHACNFINLLDSNLFWVILLVLSLFFHQQKNRFFWFCPNFFSISSYKTRVVDSFNIEIVKDNNNHTYQSILCVYAWKTILNNE